MTTLALYLATCASLQHKPHHLLEHRVHVLGSHFRVSQESVRCCVSTYTSLFGDYCRGKQLLHRKVGPGGGGGGLLEVQPSPLYTSPWKSSFSHAPVEKELAKYSEANRYNYNEANLVQASWHSFYCRNEEM